MYFFLMLYYFPELKPREIQYHLSFFSKCLGISGKAEFLQFRVTKIQIRAKNMYNNVYTVMVQFHKYLNMNIKTALASQGLLYKYGLDFTKIHVNWQIRELQNHEFNLLLSLCIAK